MHERQVGLKSAQDQYFLLDKIPYEPNGLIGFFGSRLDTEPTIRGFHPSMFRI